jgi:hypothetical protein
LSYSSLLAIEESQDKRVSQGRYRLLRVKISQRVVEQRNDSNGCYTGSQVSNGGHQRIDAFELTTTLLMTLRPFPVLRELQKSELDGAAQLLGRGMCDNPLNIRAFGIENRERRARAMSRFFLPVLEGLYRRGLVEGALNDAKLVRSMRHGTSSELPTKNVGGAMLIQFCATMDEKHELAYLETDKSENVHFYQRFGFSVIAESKVLGITNWFMLRSSAVRPQ